jgi:hypothetical protein
MRCLFLEANSYEDYMLLGAIALAPNAQPGITGSPCSVKYGRAEDEDQQAKIPSVNCMYPIDGCTERERKCYSGRQLYAKFQKLCSSGREEEVAE